MLTFLLFALGFVWALGLTLMVLNVFRTQQRSQERAWRERQRQLNSILEGTDND